MTASTLPFSIRRWLAAHPRIKASLIEGRNAAGLAKYTAASAFPILIQPTNRRMMVAVTANCNLRCIGCRYGRDFMPSSQLPLNKAMELLSDAAECGVQTVRLYGGEPLLHPDLPAMVGHTLKNGMKPFVTTNGILLEKKLDALWNAGLRTITIGYYGTDGDYDRYVQRKSRFTELERGLEFARKRYGKELDVQINFLLMRPTCSIEALRQAWGFAERFDTDFRVDLIHYSLPYFSEGPDRMLQFRPEDREAISEVVEELLRLHEQAPSRFKEAPASIRAIPDWLLKGPDMRIPCDASDILWVGADGTVQMCYVTFKLGNIYQTRLRQMLKTPIHHQGALDAFNLNCPNCHCERESRIRKHLPSLWSYRKNGHANHC
jgi:molybdenum cofactor biosynthesis enzyme MoaA